MSPRYFHSLSKSHSRRHWCETSSSCRRPNWKCHKAPFYGGCTYITFSISKNIYFQNFKEMWWITSTLYSHSFNFIISSWIPGVFIFRGFFLTSATGGWMAGRQRVTVYFDDVMKWKSVCLIVLKMRPDPCLGCICLVAGRWAVSQESYLVAWWPRLLQKTEKWLEGIWMQYVHLECCWDCLSYVHLAVNHRANQFGTPGF